MINEFKEKFSETGTFRLFKIEMRIKKYFFYSRNYCEL